MHVERWVTMRLACSMAFPSLPLMLFLGVTNSLPFQSSSRRKSEQDAYRSWASAVWLIPKDIYSDDRVMVGTPSHKSLYRRLVIFYMAIKLPSFPALLFLGLTSVLKDSLNLVNPDCELTRLLFYSSSVSPT
jgi:hypothetical protein